MSSITAGSVAAYIAHLEAKANAEVGELQAKLAAAATKEERAAVRARIKAIRAELRRRKIAAEESLF